MKVKLLQWNILYKEKIENIVQQIKILKPDIVCLQELGINCKYNPKILNTADFVRKELGYNSFFKEAQGWKDDNELDAIGNGIFTKFPITSTSAKFVQNQTKEFSDYSHEGRIYIETDIKLDNKILTVATTHLSYTRKFEITPEKKQEIDNLLEIVKSKKNNFVLTGDFNSTPNSYTIKELQNYFENCGPSFEENTWTTKPFNYSGFKEDKVRWRLDYIFATKDINCLSSKIIKTDYSDHLPILAIIEL